IWRTISFVPRAVAPANKGTRPRFTRAIVSMNPCFSSHNSAAHSPVVPQAAMELMPSPMRRSIISAEASRSTESVASQRSAPSLQGVGIIAQTPVISAAVNTLASSRVRLTRLLNLLVPLEDVPGATADHTSHRLLHQHLAEPPVERHHRH